MTLSWFPFSVLATTLFGISMAMYKIPAWKGVNKHAVSLSSMLISFLLAIILFHSSLSSPSWSMIVYALLWGVSFASIVLLQMSALHHVDTNMLFPITTTVSLALTVLTGLVAFQEHLSWIQAVAIFLIVAIVYFFLKKKDGAVWTRQVVLFFTGIVFLSWFNKILQKLVANQFDIRSFFIYQYAFAALFALLLFIYFHRQDRLTHFSSKSMIAGSVIGSCGFFGSYALMTALTKGPLTLITSLHSLYILITALVAWIVFKEELNAKKILLLAVAIIAVLLLKLG